jgi:hypothetical protein
VALGLAIPKPGSLSSGDLAIKLIPPLYIVQQAGYPTWVLIKIQTGAYFTKFYSHPVFFAFPQLLALLIQVVSRSEESTRFSDSRSGLINLHCHLY